MARAVNKVILLGYLGADPEIRPTSGNTKVAGFSMATNETYLDREGNQRQRTEWHCVVCFDKLAASCGQYLTKGSRVYVEGRLQTRSWEENNGRRRSKTEIVANQVIFLDAVAKE